MAADDDKALLLGNGYKAWFEVRTGLGERVDILLEDPSGGQIEMDYADIGMTKADAQERLGQGIASLLPALIERTESQLAEATESLQGYSKEMQRRVHIYERAIKSYREGIRTAEDEIIALQETLDEYIPESIWPDYIMRDVSLADDPEAAADFLDAFLQHDEETIQIVEGWMEELQDHYDTRNRYLESITEHNAKISLVANWEETGVTAESKMQQHQLQQRLNWLLALNEGLQASEAEKAEQGPQSSWKVEFLKDRERIAGLEKLLSELAEETEATEEIVETAAAEAEEADSNLSIYQAYVEKRKGWRGSIKLRQSLMDEIKDKRPMTKAAAKLSAMGDMLFEDILKLRTFKDPKKRTHFQEMLALRAGYKFTGRELRVRVLEREGEDRNWVLCQIEGTNIIAKLTVEFDEQQHFKAVASTCLVEDPMWTRAENETPGVPPALSQYERSKPYDLNKYVEYHHLIAANIDESRQAAE